MNFTLLRQLRCRIRPKRFLYDSYCIKLDPKGIYKQSSALLSVSLSLSVSFGRQHKLERLLNLKHFHTARISHMSDITKNKDNMETTSEPHNESDSGLKFNIGENDVFQSVFSPTLLELQKICDKNGMEIRMAGGAVRDILQGLTPHDIDFATTSTPDEMKAIFTKENVRIIEYGARAEGHGTVTVRINDAVSLTRISCSALIS